MASDDLTALLQRVKCGDESARAPCMAQMRAELNKLISAESSRQTPSTLRGTFELIERVYAERYGANGDAAGHATFVTIAAGTLRQALADYARVRVSLRRSGGKALVESDETISVGEDRIAAILIADDAIQALSSVDANHGAVILLRFFGALDTRGAASVLQLPESAVELEWRYAKVWLRPPFELPCPWFAAKALFTAASAAAPSEQSEILNRECGGDAALRYRVETLLARTAISDGWLEPIALPLAAEALVGSLENLRISHYQVDRLIGQGGMGEVYSARDVRLGRDVAIKVLRDQSFAAGDVQAALMQEARAIAGIKHPSICTIYDVGEHERRSFLVLELLEGQTLGNLLRSGPLAIAVFIDFASQICEGLAAAHSIGVIHRDIKPSNLHVSAGDKRRVKILDFGLARVGRSDAGSAQPSRPFTKPASSESTSTTLAGTVPFMSPEQVKSLPLDAKTDIFSLGVVFYEMLTDARPFEAPDWQGTFDRIVNSRPAPPARLRAEVPARLDRLVMSMLEKEPAARPSIGQVLDALQDFAGKSTPERRKLRIATAAAVLLAALLPAGVYLFRTNPSMRSAPRVSKLWSSDTPGQEEQPALSADGSTVVFVSNRSGKWHIYRQSVSAGKAIDLTNDAQAEDSEPALSPDGSFIAFASKGRSQGSGLYLMRAADGAQASRLTPFGHQPAWAPDGKRLAFVDEALNDPKRKTATSALYVVALSGAIQRIYAGDARQPKWSPHGSRIAFVSVTGGGQRTLQSITPAGAGFKAIDVAPFIDWSPDWSADGRYLFFCSDRGRSMNLWRVPLDEASGGVNGKPEPVTVPDDYIGQISAARNSKFLAYTQDLSRTAIYKVRLDGARVAGEPLSIRLSSHGELEAGLNPSPDGSKVAFQTYRYRENIFVATAADGSLKQLSSSPANDRDARWSPDGSQLAFQSNRSGTWQIWRMNADGGNPTQLSFDHNYSVNPAWSPDGHRLAFSQPAGSVGILDLSRKSSNGYVLTRLPPPSLGDGSNFFLAKSWSHQGNLLAGSLHYSNGDPIGIAIQNVDTGVITQLTNDGGLAPVWLPESRIAVYRRGESLYSVDAQSKKVARLNLEPKFHVFDNIGITADGRWLFFDDLTSETDVVLISLSSD
jgi:Tol biopolymer transport system component